MKLALALLLASSSAFAATHRNIPRDLNEILSYQCEATFLEGEGVNGDYISCVPYQRLGLIQAKYKHYLYRNANGSNFHHWGHDTDYPNVCGRWLPRTRCSQSRPRTAFGLATIQSPDFPVAVNLSPGPGLAPELVGFAAQTSRSGECADGLIRVWAHTATPRSMDRPLPSSFLNLGGRLNSTVIGQEVLAEYAFDVTRSRSSIGCDSIGNCAYAQFDEAELAQSALYRAGPKSVCVVPGSYFGDDDRGDEDEQFPAPTFRGDRRPAVLPKP